MKHALIMEGIGDNIRWLKRHRCDPRFHPKYTAPKAWVAEVSFGPHGRIDRKFLPYDKDYSTANGVGSRGTMYQFILDENQIYEVEQPLTWKHSRHCYLIHDGTAFLELSLNEAMLFNGARRNV